MSSETSGMTVVINREEILPVEPYDDLQTIVERYAATREDRNADLERTIPVLPEHLSVQLPDGIEKFQFQPGEEMDIQIFDVWDRLTPEDEEANFETLILKKYPVETVAKNAIQREFRDIAINSFLEDYPQLTIEDLTMMWLFKRYPEIPTNPKIAQGTVTEPMRHDFKTYLDRLVRSPTQEALFFFYAERYPELLRENREIFLRRMQRRRRALQTLKAALPAEYEPFRIEETTVEVQVIPSNGEALEDIFDSFNVSQDLPFILLAVGEKRWYKVFRHSPPPREWVGWIPVEDGIYFKIATAHFPHHLYSDGRWLKAEDEGEPDRVQFFLAAREQGLDRNYILSLFFDSLVEIHLITPLGGEDEYRPLLGVMEDDKIPYKEVGIKGVFTSIISSGKGVIGFNRAMFADLVVNNPSFRYFLFFNEKESTVLEKTSGFFFYFQLHQTYNRSQALTVTATPHAEEGGNPEHWVDVRVKRARTIQEIEIFQRIFVKLLGLYTQERDKVVDLYARIYPSSRKFFRVFDESPEEKKEDQKTGWRLRRLKEQRPEMFLSDYSTDCDKNRQPFLIQDWPLVRERLFQSADRQVPANTRRIEELTQRQAELQPIIEETETIPKDLAEIKELRAEYYTIPGKISELEETNDRFQQLTTDYQDVQTIDQLREFLGNERIHAYLNPETGEVMDEYVCDPREVDDKPGNIIPFLVKNDNINRHSYPTLPCCFMLKSGTRKVSKMDTENQIHEREVTGEIRTILKNRKKKGVKTLERGRLGVLPTDFFYLLEMAGYTKQPIEEYIGGFPFYRYGVMHSPSSFLHCLEVSRGMQDIHSEYINSQAPGRDEIVRKVRREWAGMSDFGIARQELYDYTDDQIKEILINDGVYLAPEMWVRLAEVYYQCNIFLYQIIPPLGIDILLPRYSQAYLHREINPDYPSVFIIRKKVEKEFYPYQCELIIHLDKTLPGRRKITAFFQERLLAKAAIRILNQKADVTVVTPQEAFPYISPPLPLPDQISDDDIRMEDVEVEI